MDFRQTQVTLDVPTTYSLEPCEGSAHGLLVLHGFSDHARSTRKRLLGLDPVPGFIVLAPNAVFPSPVRVGDEFKEAYSWYFRDPTSGKQMISPDFAAQALIQLVRDLGLESLTWTTLGFSQGGFFAPYLLRHGLKVGAMIAVGAAYRPEAYEGLPPVRVYGIHGEADREVPLESAESSFRALERDGYGVSFTRFPGLGHTLHAEGRERVRAILESERGR